MQHRERKTLYNWFGFSIIDETSSVDDNHDDEDGDEFGALIYAAAVVGLEKASLLPLMHRATTVTMDAKRISANFLCLYLVEYLRFFTWWNSERCILGWKNFSMH